MYVKNWRPLTLMNVDHKIYAKALAACIKPVLEYLIGKQQTGYMQGWFIGMNIRRLIDLLDYVEREKIPALLIAVDFEKCFDTIEFCAIRGTLEYYGFGPKFIEMILLLYQDFETKLSYNGNLSQAFRPSQAVHQGCAVSGYLFILTAEILANNIKNNEKIKGIKLGDDEELVLQYVDDMNLISMCQQESLEEIV